MRRCMHWLPKAVARRGSIHFGTGCGGCQRSAPTGGAANGIPLKLRRPSAGGAPSIGPALVITLLTDGCGAAVENTRRNAAAIILLMPRSIPAVVTRRPSRISCRHAHHVPACPDRVLTGDDRRRYRRVRSITRAAARRYAGSGTGTRGGGTGSATLRLGRDRQPCRG